MNTILHMIQIVIKSFSILCLMILSFHSVAEMVTAYPKNQIPKVIHYVWLGSNEPPPKAQECIASWRRYHPDFEIKKWNEENCDITANPFIKDAYKKKRYDYASDYCRIQALKEGGIYLDTDMLLKGPLTPILDAPIVLTLQRERELSGSFMAAVPDHPFVLALGADYESRTEFDDFELYNAPHTWSRNFEAFFHNPPTVEKKPEYHIVAPNILMYDFGGGEALAEHLYGSGSQDVQQSQWYHIFRKIYLKQFSFYIPEEKKYFIPQNEAQGYFYTPDNEKASAPMIYHFQDDTLEIQEGDKKHSFLCADQICK